MNLLKNLKKFYNIVKLFDTTTNPKSNFYYEKKLGQELA